MTDRPHLQPLLDDAVVVLDAPPRSGPTATAT